MQEKLYLTVGFKSKEAVMTDRTITLTSKRQATFPVELCRELGVGPGDKLRLSSCMVAGKPVWVIQNAESVKMPWLGTLREFADGKPDEMDDIRRSIGEHTGQKL